MKVYYGINQSFVCDEIRIDKDKISVLAGAELYTKDVIDYIDFIVVADDRKSIEVTNKTGYTCSDSSIRSTKEEKWVYDIIKNCDATNIPKMRVSRVRYKVFVSNEKVHIVAKTYFEAYTNLCGLLVPMSEFPNTGSLEEMMNFIWNIMNENGWEHVDLMKIDKDTMMMAIDAPKNMVSTKVREYTLNLDLYDDIPMTSTDNSYDIKSAGFVNQGLLSRHGFPAWCSIITEV